MAAIDCRLLTIVNTVNVKRIEKSQLFARGGSGEGPRLCTPNSTKVGFMPGLVVCSGRADEPRFIIVLLTLMTPRPSPPGIASKYPSPQMRMAGAHPWRLESTGASRMVSGQSTRLWARRASSRQQLPDWNTRGRCRGSSILSKPVPSCPAYCACSWHVVQFSATSQAGCGAHRDIDSRIVSLDSCSL
jgi:hypothetical protein